MSAQIAYYNEQDGSPKVIGRGDHPRPLTGQFVALFQRNDDDVDDAIDNKALAERKDAMPEDVPFYGIQEL